MGGNDTIFGGDSNDTLFGGDGDDTFSGALTYQSAVDGGAGVDTLDLSASTVDFSMPGTFVIDIDQGVSISGGASFTDGSYSNLENITSFDFVAIKMIGNAANNHLISSHYDDTIRGEDGNDVLEGRDGDDMLYGDAGNDTLIGGNGIDSLYGSAGKDTLVVLGGTGSDDLYGGNGNDTGDFRAITDADMVFNSAQQTYAFSAGGETFAMNSIEKILAGPGDDLFVGANAYTLTINGGAGTDTLDLSSSYINVSTLGDFVIDIDQGFSTNGAAVTTLFTAVAGLTYCRVAMVPTQFTAAKVATRSVARPKLTTCSAMAVMMTSRREPAMTLCRVVMVPTPFADRGKTMF